MTPAELTAIIGAGAAVATGTAVPIYLNRRQANLMEEATGAASTQGFAQLLVAERDRLQGRLDMMEARYAQQLTDAEAKWRVQYQAAMEQVVQLKQEIEALYRRLYEHPPSSSPPP